MKYIPLFYLVCIIEHGDNGHVHDEHCKHDHDDHGNEGHDHGKLESHISYLNKTLILALILGHGHGHDEGGYETFEYTLRELILILSSTFRTCAR